MRKKLVCILIILIVSLFTATISFANPPDGIIGDAAYIEEDVKEDGENENEKIDPLEEFLQEIIKSIDMEETEQFLVTLTKPKPIVFEKMNICGFLINGSIGTGEVITVILARYNDETGLYEEFKNTEGESRWNIGIFGLFTKEVKLPEGINRLKLIIYKIPAKPENLINTDTGNAGKNVELNGEKKVGIESEVVEDNARVATDIETEAKIKVEAETKAENINLEAGKDLQVNFFTIKVHDETTRDKLINTKVKISDIINNILPK